MKFLAIVLFLFCSSAQAFESGPDNGTDYVKILFSEAQHQLVNLAEPVSSSTLEQSNIDSVFVEWLTSGPNPRWPKLKYMFKRVDLAYQNDLCEDQFGRKSTICFVNVESAPTVLISVTGNKLTTKTQAMAMLVHEAGHFLNEMDHLFLNDLGVSLVSFLLTPRIFEFVKTDSEFVSNMFYDKDRCIQGTSDLSLGLIKQAKFALNQQCLASSTLVSCQDAQFSYVFEAEAEWVQGRGFTQRVLCKIKAQLVPKKG